MKCFALLALLAFVSPAFADTPSKVSREDLLDLENVQLKFNELQRQADALAGHRDELLKKYGLKWDDLGKTARVAADGTIQRAEAPKQPKPTKK